MRIQSQHLQPYIQNLRYLPVPVFVCHPPTQPTSQYMASTSGSKPPSRSPSPPTPPPHCATHKHKQEADQVEADKPFVKEQHPSREGKEIYEVTADDLPPETSKEVKKRRLASVQDPLRIDEIVLSRLKSLLLDASPDQESLPNMLDFSEIVVRMFQTKRWGELVDNLLGAIHANSETRQEMALRVLLFLPAQGAFKFLSENYELLDIRFFYLLDSPNLNIQALTFDASVKLIMCQIPELKLDDLFPKMIVWLQQAFRKDAQIDILEPRIRDLVEIARYNTDCFKKFLDSVLACIFEIAETAYVNFIKCQAIEIIKILQEQNSNSVSQFLRKLSKESKRSIFENCVRLMFSIADVPSWYDMDKESNESLGISGNYEQGKFLLLQVCLHTHEDILLSFGNEMIPQYLNSEDWQTRHAGVIAFAITSRACGPERIREQTERVVDISLADPHPRVRSAAIEVIWSSISDHKAHARYLNKFLPRLVTVIRSSASIYPRVQFHATVTVRYLINYCDHEDGVRSFSEDLVPELLKFLKQGGKFRDEAMEILRSLAVLFPIAFRSHYQETVDFLNLLLSQSLLGEKFIEFLSYIFSGFLKDWSTCLLSDTDKAFTIAFKILDDWRNTDHRVTIHISEALSQLCKLPQNDEFLNKTVPVLIQILEKTKDPTALCKLPKPVADKSHDKTLPLLIHILANTENSTTSSTIGKKRSPTCQMRILACDLLSTFALQFPVQFEPWVSRVSRLLTSLWRSPNAHVYSCDPDVAAAKIASVDALPTVLLSWKHVKEPRGLINSTVQALVKASRNENKRAVDRVMLKNLTRCIVIFGPIFSVHVIKQIVSLIGLKVSQSLYLWPSFADLETSAGVTDYELEQEEEIIRAALECLEMMICKHKSAFLPHVDELLPLVVALWDPESKCPDKVKKAGISIFNMLLEADCPYKLQRYRHTYPLVVMHFCDSKSPKLQREAARGIGICATHTQLISNFDAPVAINCLFHVITCALRSEKKRAYDAAVSALGKVYEFRLGTIDGPQVVSSWLELLPLRNDLDEAEYAHQQLCRMFERRDPNLLGPNNENRDKITQILLKIVLLQRDE